MSRMKTSWLASVLVSIVMIPAWRGRLTRSVSVRPDVRVEGPPQPCMATTMATRPVLMGSRAS
jgi:hypothetical protein